MQPIRWQKEEVQVLDQRKLPHVIEWLSIRSAKGMAEAIKNMVLRGAPLIGIAAAYGLALEAKQSAMEPGQLFSYLKNQAEILQAARPTAVNLAWAIRRMLEQAEKGIQEKKALQEILIQEAIKIHKEEEKTCIQIGKFGAELVFGENVLTHCNTGGLATGGEGTAYAVIKESFRQGKIARVFACEARPFLQGARLTALELKEDNIPFTLITDSMAGYFMQHGKIQTVAVGADRIAANGDTANKIGTYSLAVLAHENKIPFYVAAPLSTLDLSLTSGEEIPLEERDASEVTSLMGIQIAPDGVLAANPAFDITPACYIKSIITEKGIATAPFAVSLADLMHAKQAANR